MRQRIGDKIRWAVFSRFEDQIQTLITERILLYHKRLVREGFIPDLRPPYRGRSSAASISPQDPLSQPSDPEDGG